MGLAGMAGAAGAGDAMSQLFDQRMKAAQLQMQDQHFKAQQAQQDALTRLKYQEQADKIKSDLEAKRQAESDKVEARKSVELGHMDAQIKEIPTDVPIGQDTVNKYEDLGGAPQRFNPIPITPPAAGQEGAPPASIAAPGQDAPPPMPGTRVDSPMARAQFTRIPTAQEQQHQADQAQKQTDTERNMADREFRTGVQSDLATFRMNQPAKEPTNSFQLQPEIDPATGKQTGRFLGYNTKTNTWAPVQGQGPASTKAAPGAAQLNVEEHFKTEAIDTLKQLDTAIDNAKDLIGPGEGRISNIEQMAGNADPKIQALGVKMKAAKMRVDHAITGSVRAGASPVLLQQWDNILANKITPEGLKAGVQAMREIIGGGADGKVEKWVRDASGNMVKQ